MAEHLRPSGSAAPGRPPVITIDGPAGAGKSTIARRLAQRLGYRYLDTGAMYRAITWRAVHAQLDWSNEEALVRLANETELELREAPAGVQVVVDGRDVTSEIRGPEITQQVYHVADSARARRRLIELQRQFAVRGPVVTEGRDQGTDVFPDAPVKVYLDASAEERARRRLLDYPSAGKSATYEAVLASVIERDTQDRQRAVGALRRAPDAIYVDTTSLTIDQVVETLARECEHRLGLTRRPAS